MPLWLTGSDDASNDALVLFQYVHLRSLLERREALWCVEVPDGATHPLTRAVWFGKIDMPYRPACVCTDLTIARWKTASGLVASLAAAVMACSNSKRAVRSTTC